MFAPKIAVAIQKTSCNKPLGLMSGVETYFCSCLTGKLSIPQQFMWFFRPIPDCVFTSKHVLFWALSWFWRRLPLPFLQADKKQAQPFIYLFICRISYCTTDKLQNKVFAYVAQNPQSGALECHAFLSPKKKIVSSCDFSREGGGLVLRLTWILWFALRRQPWLPVP